MEKVMEELQKKGLYDSSFEHDNCGIGAVVQIDGKVSHKLVTDALSIVEKLEQEKMRKERPETELESLHRYRINSL